MWAWLLLVLVAALVFTPLGALLYGSLRTGSPGDPAAVFSLDNIKSVYGGLFADSWTRAATLGSLSLAVPVMIIACAIGAFLAWAVTRTDLRGRRVFEIAFLLPMLYSPLVGVIGWSVLADPRGGLVNLMWTGLTGVQEPLINVYSYLGIVWVMSCYFIPYAFVLNVGTFRTMDPALEEAASMSGANLWQRVTRITLPIMTGSLAAAALFIFTLALEQFAIPGFLGSHIRFSTLAYSIYLRTNGYPADLPGAAAAGTLLILFAAIGLYCYRRLTRRSEKFITVSARGYKPALTDLGRLRPVVLSACVLIFIASTLLPLAAVILRSLMPVRTGGVDFQALTLANYTSLFQAEDIMLGLRNSVYLAAGTATACALIGLVLSYRMVRQKSPQMTLADYLIAMPVGIPGTVFGIGMLWAYVRTPLYLTLWILFLAFVTRYLVYGVRTLGNGMMQIDRALEESASVAGAGPLRTFLFVNLPLLKPAISSMWLLVFMIVMREISASVILYGVDSVTMPVLTWSYLLDGAYGIASALSIVQLVIVGVIVLLFRWAFGSEVKSRAVS
ncbi:MAG: iron ABC transporter permease [Pigmentiphaga sp.]|uniref:ABC transporter permease n=1 Tax=Pigmentiphaga sp. TaxID=1977564 RepID=UPI0029B2ADEA|nr:iron ABC transporter permease [Pigmentiphaga sp.]MDX3905578.1 iron ABC transporter permease [Pigmentiphaga sp.]